MKIVYVSPLCDLGTVTDVYVLCASVENTNEDFIGGGEYTW